MFTRLFHAVAYPIERGFYRIEMLIAAIRRGLHTDVDNILSHFDRVTADLNAYVKRQEAAQQADQASMNALYDRIDARRAAVGRASQAAANIQKLTGAQ